MLAARAARWATSATRREWPIMCGDLRSPKSAMQVSARSTCWPGQQDGISRFGLQQQVPEVALVQVREQVAEVVGGEGRQGGVERPPGPEPKTLRDLGRVPGGALLTDQPGDVHDPHRQADRLARGELLGAHAVPALVDMGQPAARRAVRAPGAWPSARPPRSGCGGAVPSRAWRTTAPSPGRRRGHRPAATSQPAPAPARAGTPRRWRPGGSPARARPPPVDVSCDVVVQPT